MWLSVLRAIVYETIVIQPYNLLIGKKCLGPNSPYLSQADIPFTTGGQIVQADQTTWHGNFIATQISQAQHSLKEVSKQGPTRH